MDVEVSLDHHEVVIINAMSQEHKYFIRVAFNYLVIIHFYAKY